MSLAVWMAALVLVGVAAPLAHAANHTPDGALNVYFIDVEGGQATLFVTPSGESLLIDTGWPDSAKRIAQTARQAGLSKIDYVLITHYHRDHVGGVAQLLQEIPVGTFIDHGDNRETTNPEVEQLWHAYESVIGDGQHKRIVVKAGESLPLRDLKTTILSADGAVIDRPLPGAGAANAACAATGTRPVDETENARSVGTLFTFGVLRILDLADLTWDREVPLMCPENKIGSVDVYIVSHHGWVQSGSPALVEGIRPRVAIMDNGAKKGCSPPAWDILHQAPGLRSLWQLHYSQEGGAAHNSPRALIANLSGPDAANYLRLTAWPDGRFEVFNSRTRKTKRYRPT
jgi:beta-lactamase superfamily II metal-dependent hydrolase